MHHYEYLYHRIMLSIKNFALGGENVNKEMG